MNSIKKNSLLLIVLFCLSQVCNAQPSLKTGWDRIYVKDIGTFDLPPTMEVQKGKYKEYIDKSRGIIGLDATQITAQQIGLNEFGKVSFEKYARVMIETYFGQFGDYEKLNFDISLYKPTEVDELNNIYKQQFQNSIVNTNLKIIEWYPLKIEKINGMSCIHISYKRQAQNNPYVLVHKYYFHNNDRMYDFTLSYRISEMEYWKSDFEKILSSFVITNIK